MTTRPTDEEVLAALPRFTAESTARGETVTVAAFAEYVGLKRPTLYARFPDVISSIQDQKAAQANLGPDRRAIQIAELKRQRADARRAQKEAERLVRVLSNQIRLLALENAALKNQLETIAGVAPFKPRRVH